MASKFDFEKITSHLQLTGYVFPGSQIYGGLANSWDYGPLGAELKKNVKAAWWKKFVQESPTNVGLRRCDFDESEGLGGHWPRFDLQRSDDRLQILQGPPSG
jgi:glycyl-tRNA synthetase (class II)